VAYYYLVAQLPYLRYTQEKAPISSAAFKAMCFEYLSKSDFAALEYCRLGISEKEAAEPIRGHSSFLKKWLKRERDVILTLAALRAEKQKRTERPVLPENRQPAYEIERDARAVFEQTSPLEAELALDQGRWKAAEEFAAGDYFGINLIYSYMIKLLLIERRASFNTEEGFAEYNTLYAEILKSAPGTGVAGETL